MSLAIGGKTPLASHVKKTIFEGDFPIEGRWEFLKKFKGNDVFAFGLSLTS